MLPPKPPGVNELHTFLREDLYTRYIRHAQLQGVSHRSIETKLGMFLHKQLGAGLKDKRPYRRHRAPPLLRAAAAQGLPQALCREAGAARRLGGRGVGARGVAARHQLSAAGLRRTLRH